MAVRRGPGIGTTWVLILAPRCASVTVVSLGCLVCREAGFVGSGIPPQDHACGDQGRAGGCRGRTVSCSMSPLLCHCPFAFILGVSEWSHLLSCSLCLSVDLFSILWGSLSPPGSLSVSVSVPLPLSPLYPPLSPSLLCLSVSPHSTPSPSISVPFLVPHPILLSSSLFISSHLCPTYSCPSAFASFPRPSLSLATSPLTACPKPLTWTITGWPRPG